jgi:hypothetical protein
MKDILLAFNWVDLFGCTLYRLLTPCLILIDCEIDVDNIIPIAMNLVTHGLMVKADHRADDRDRKSVRGRTGYVTLNINHK